MSPLDWRSNVISFCFYFSANLKTKVCSSSAIHPESFRLHLFEIYLSFKIQTWLSIVLWTKTNVYLFIFQKMGLSNPHFFQAIRIKIWTVTYWKLFRKTNFQDHNRWNRKKVFFFPSSWNYAPTELKRKSFNLIKKENRKVSKIKNFPGQKDPHIIMLIRKHYFLHFL